MKTLLLIALIILVGWFLMGKLKHNSAVKKMQEAPVRYAESLQNDEKKAAAIRDLANKKIERDTQDIEKAINANQ